MREDNPYPEPKPNQKPAGEKWNQLYQGDRYLFGKEPVDSLKLLAPHLRKGRAMDIAMGEGRNAVFLAGQGFQVDCIDASSVGVEKAKKLATEKSVKIEPKVQNLDFFLMPLMKFDTVVMTYFKPQARFFSEVRRGLVVGGTFLLEAYTVEHIKANPQHSLEKGATGSGILEFEDCYKPNEVLGYMNGFHVLYYNELKAGQAHLVQLLARKASV